MRVKEICKLINGRAFKPSDWAYNGVPIVRIQNLNDESASFNYYSGEYDPIHEINNGELLFSWSGTPGTSFGAFRWYRGKGVLNQHIFRVIPIIQIDKDYLMYAFNGNLHTIISKAHGGVGLQHITKKELDEIEIHVPAINVQLEIVAIIKRVKELINKRQCQLLALDTLIKARFVEMFGDPKINEKQWDIGTVGEYFDVKGGKRIPKGMDYSDEVTKHPYLRATDMKNETILDDDIHYIGEDVFEHIKRYIVQGGDIYLTNVGVNLGMAGVIPDKYNGANLTENAVKLVPKTDRFRGIFIANYINSPGIQEYITERKMAVGVPKLAIFRIETMPLIIPPIEKQDEFADFRAQVDKSKVVVQAALDKAQLLFDTLMQQCFG